MSPLGKFTLAVWGLRLAGADGFFLGLWLGHILIDNSKVIHKIESAMAQLDDNIRLMLPYNASRYYNRIEGNFWGKIWGAVLGSVLFGFYGFLLLFIVGHFVFDTPRSSHARAFRAKFDELFNAHIGKISGGILGFVSGSNILVFVGVVLGFFFDMRHKLKFALKLPKLVLPMFIWGGNRYLKTVAALAAKIAKADGVVSATEIKTFKNIFKIDERDNSQISKIFNKAKETVDGYEHLAKVLGKLTADKLELKEKVVESLFKIAWVDGQISDFERGVLRKISDLIGLPEGNFKVIEERFEPKPASKANVCDFYDILGVMHNASDSEIKKRWRELIQEYHPDKVQASGGTPAEVEASTLKMAEINAAYEALIKSRHAA